MSEKTKKWHSYAKEREGRLLRLRYPPKKNYEDIQPKLHLLVWGTYTQTEFPEIELSFDELHQSIVPLDEHIISGLPCPVLIETFLRKRTYYSYAPENFSFKDLQASAQTAFPKEELTWESKLDPHWKLLRSCVQEIDFRDH